jgi:hypothetical protein
VTWNFLSSASAHQRTGSAGLFQAVLSEIVNDHAELCPVLTFVGAVCTARTNQ